MYDQTSDSSAGTATKPSKPAFPFLDLAEQFSGIRGEVMAAITRVMESQEFILGPEVAALEKEIALRVGCKFAIGCASGSDALLLALMALGVGPGDDVIVPPFTFVATAGSAARLQAKPVFVDIDPVTYNLDPEQLQKSITPRTKAIVPVHLFGLAADMDSIMEIAGRHKIPVVEDAAQAVGAQYKGRQVGSIGVVGCFSFFPSKNLGGAGDGGLITTSDAALAETLKVLRVHGSRQKYQYEKLGINSRLDSLQAAVLRVKLKYLDTWAAGRQRNADRYRTLFAQHGLDSKIKMPTTLSDRVHVYNQFTIRVAQRDALKQHLRQDGIPTEIYYPCPLHLQPAFGSAGYKKGDCPVSERASESVLSLPVFPELSEQQQRLVVSSIAEFYRKESGTVQSA